MGSDTVHCSLLGTVALNPGDRQHHTAALNSLIRTVSRVDGTVHWTPGFLGSKLPTELSARHRSLFITSTLLPTLSPPLPISFSSHPLPLSGIILLYHLFSLFTTVIFYNIKSLQTLN